jgi:hypothetical protein
LSDSVAVSQAVNISDTLIANGVETVNITVGANTAGLAVANTLNVDTNDAATTINIATDVNTNFTLLNTDTSVRTVNASGVQGQNGSAGSGFVWVSGSIADGTGSLVVTGSVKGGDSITLTNSNDTTLVTVNAGTNTVIGSSSKANVINGGTGADTITGGGVADTITGNGGADNITGGVGADLITLGVGNATIINGLGSTGVNNAASLTVSILTSTFDIDTGVNAGDVLSLTSLGATATASVSAVANATDLAAINNSVALARGTYSGGVFTYNASGADTLVTFDTDNTATVVGQSVVLVGYAASTANTSLAYLAQADAVLTFA